MRSRRRSRAEAARKAWLAQAMQWPVQPWPADDRTPNYAANSNAGRYQQEAPACDASYKETVAERAMAAIDAMPAPYRRLLQDYGIGVYTAWRRGWPPSRVEEAGRRSGVLVV